MISAQQTLPVFDIRHFIDQLQPAKKKGKFICPACGEDNFTVSKKLNEHGVPNFECWNRQKDQAHKREIKEALRPWSEVVGNQKKTVRKGSYILNSATGEWVRGAVKPSKKLPKPAPLPSEGVTLARLTEPATDSPKPQQKRSKQHGQTLTWRFNYSPFQWVERVQWADESKSKGYDKTYRQWHLAEAGEEVPVWENGKQVGTREAAEGEPVCSKGTAAWMPYRWESAIAAARAGDATFLIGCEGEPAVEQYRQQGYAAITLQGSDWSEETIADLVSQLKAENLGLVYHPDHDTAGYKKAELLQKGCNQADVPFLAIVPTNINPDLAPKGDVVDLVALIGGEEFIKRLEAEIHCQVELRQQRGGGNSEPPSHRGSGGDDSDEEPDDGNPDNPFKEICRDLNLPFECCVTRQQFDGSAYRVLFGGEQGDWMVINSGFYRWSGTYWEHISETVIHKMISDYGQMAFKIGFERGSQPYVARPYENNAHKESAFKYCRSRLEKHGAIANAHLLTFNDCVVDLRTAQTMPHDKEFRLTNLIPHSYESSSECPEVFRNFVIESFGEEMLEVIRAFTSMFLDPTAPYGRFPHLVGKSGGGKGTLGRFWSSLFGEDGFGSASAFFDIATPEGRHQHLTGKKIFGFPDMGGYSQGLRAFYELVDNGPMSGRALFSAIAYSKTWNLRFWLASVDFLQIENAGDGWARRAYVISVLERLVTPDPHLSAKLQAVKAEVIAWALAMPRAERDAILLLPATSDRAKSLARDAALFGDSTRSFVDLCLRPTTDAKTTISNGQIHTWYVAYCREHGYTPLGQSKFISHLKTVLPRHYAERVWGEQINKQRSRISAHWKQIAPVPEVFVSASGGLDQNPQWICLKAKCADGGIEDFENLWESTSAKILKPSPNAGVQGVQGQNVAENKVDTLKPIFSTGVQGGSTVHSESLCAKIKTDLKPLQENKNDDFAEVETPLGHLIQNGHPHCEGVLACPPCSEDDFADGQPGHPHWEKYLAISVDREDEQAPKLLKPGVIERALQRISEVDSIESFQLFHDRYERCSEVQKRQILDAFAKSYPDDQERFYECWQNFEATSTPSVADSVPAVEVTQKPVGQKRGLGSPLKPEMLIQVLQSMAAIKSVSTFEEFKINYERLTDGQQRQVWSDARPEVQQNYQHWQDAFLAVPESVWTARKALLGVVNFGEMNAVRREHDREVLSLALKLIHPSSHKHLKRLLEEAKKVQPSQND